jgi:SAM-dependent methyltransferase
MSLDFSNFDNRNYETLGTREGYAEWAATYEDSVYDEMDVRLLERITSVRWPEVERAIDLACGTGRTGAWLREHGVERIDGIDLTPEMLEAAKRRGIYDTLKVGDITSTGLADGTYDLAIACLVDEHLADLGPLYREVARIVKPGGRFVIVGYHPHFIMTARMPTHFHRASGRPVAIETYVHLFSDHTTAARAAGLTLEEMHEGVLDDPWLARQPKWARFRNHPISFAQVWRR